ncbi:histidine phosphatase family protein [Glacieibacterium frigidum]|uniref:Histidine phosphatase family protein n=1 Tax=Glacieibacterium frigidum TaxID=2593303 RepID=A0A552UFU3_9SPHN|nr:histidine phosphatase family protein [Glacieibacterium frigidum]TRW17059.1 histidine phosphatase family protein [Glacieibacterium frigidum]
MRRWLLLLLLIAGPAQADEAGWRAFLQPGTHAIMRHAEAPGTGDPPGFRLDDCATQRNLNAAGRAQAARIGAAIRARSVPLTAVLTSQWCRATDTARLLGLGAPRALPVLTSFFAQPGAEARATAALKAALAGRGKSLLVSHQVNITALTGVFPASGEIVVFSLSPGGAVRVEGRI